MGKVANKIKNHDKLAVLNEEGVLAPDYLNERIDEAITNIIRALRHRLELTQELYNNRANVTECWNRLMGLDNVILQSFNTENFNAVIAFFNHLQRHDMQAKIIGLDSLIASSQVESHLLSLDAKSSVIAREGLNYITKYIDLVRRYLIKGK